MRGRSVKGDSLFFKERDGLTFPAFSLFLLRERARDRGRDEQRSDIGSWEPNLDPNILLACRPRCAASSFSRQGRRRTLRGYPGPGQYPFTLHPSPLPERRSLSRVRLDLDHKFW